MTKPSHWLYAALLFAALAPAHADSLVSNYLRTRDAQEFGLTLSSYSYQEPVSYTHLTLPTIYSV